MSVFRVSSVLNRDVKQFGKKFLFDGHDDTCWNSDQVSKYAPINVFPKIGSSGLIQEN